MGEKSVDRVAKFELMRRYRPTYLLISGAENLYKMFTFSPNEVYR